MTAHRPTDPLTCDEARDLAAGFVLGALDPAEMAAVRDHLSTCVEPHPEFDELGGVVPYLADALEPVEPPATLGARVLAAVAADAAPGGSRATASALSDVAKPSSSPAAGADRATPSSSVVVDLASERARRRSPLIWVAAAAAVLLIAVLGAWNVALRTELDDADAYAAAVDQVLALAATPGGQAAILTPGAVGGPSGVAAVGSDGRIQLAMRGLAPTSGSQVYEAWVIGVGGPDPIAIGSFTPDGQGFGTLTTSGASGASGVTIALTLEPSAGRTTPTPPVLASGVASGSS